MQSRRSGSVVYEAGKRRLGGICASVLVTSVWWQVNVVLEADGCHRRSTRTKYHAPPSRFVVGSTRADGFASGLVFDQVHTSGGARFVLRAYLVGTRCMGALVHATAHAAQQVDLRARRDVYGRPDHGAYWVAGRDALQRMFPRLPYGVFARVLFVDASRWLSRSRGVLGHRARLEARHVTFAHVDVSR